MANKAINDLLKYGSIGFKETFTTTYVPANTSTLYSNVYNGWSIYDTVGDFNGIKGQFNGSSFYMSSGTAAGGSQLSKIYRNKEGYSVNRPMDISFSYDNNCTSSDTNNGTVCAELSIGGNYAKTSFSWANYSLWTPNFGGIAISCQNANIPSHIPYGTGNLVLYVNGSAVSSRTHVLANGVLYYIFLKIRGNTISYGYNTTNTPPATWYSYTASSITQISNSLIVGIGGGASNNSSRSVTFDNLNVQLY